MTDSRELPEGRNRLLVCGTTSPRPPRRRVGPHGTHADRDGHVGGSPVRAAGVGARATARYRPGGRLRRGQDTCHGHAAVRQLGDTGVHDGRGRRHRRDVLRRRSAGGGERRGTAEGQASAERQDPGDLADRRRRRSTAPGPVHPHQRRQDGGRSAGARADTAVHCHFRFHFRRTRFVPVRTTGDIRESARSRELALVGGGGCAGGHRHGGVRGRPDPTHRSRPPVRRRSPTAAPGGSAAALSRTVRRPGGAPGPSHSAPVSPRPTPARGARPPTATRSRRRGRGRPANAPCRSGSC